MPRLKVESGSLPEERDVFARLEKNCISDRRIQEIVHSLDLELDRAGKHLLDLCLIEFAEGDCVADVATSFADFCKHFEILVANAAHDGSKNERNRARWSSVNAFLRAHRLLLLACGSAKKGGDGGDGGER